MNQNSIAEILSLILSALAVVYGVHYLFKKGTPRFFQLYVWAAGCYMLEELWVIVNLFLGNGVQDGLLTARLVGFFGCLCFMLSANANEFDKVVNDVKEKKVILLSLIAPLVLIILFVIYALSPANLLSAGTKIVGFITISPAVFASYFNLKHLLLPEDAMGLLKITKSVNIFSLVFFVANYIYPFVSLFAPREVMSAYDLLLTAIMFVIIVLCRKGAELWKTNM